MAMTQIKNALRFLADLAIVGAPPLLRDTCGIAGACLVAYGTWRIYEPAGFITAGVLLLAGAIMTGRSAA
jgi:hypothetical protein